MRVSSLYVLAGTVATASAFAPGISRSLLHSQQQHGLSMSDAADGEAVAVSAAVSEVAAPEPTIAELLGRPARPGRQLRVAIAGGGVGGLTTALCMLKRGFDVTIYEKTAAFARFGGPIQFASNALSVIKEIDETLFERVMDKFTFTGTRACGIKDGLRADGSFRMTDDSLDYLWNKDAPADWFVKFPLKQCADLYGLPYTGVINRPTSRKSSLKNAERSNLTSSKTETRSRDTPTRDPETASS